MAVASVWLTWCRRRRSPRHRQLGQGRRARDPARPHPRRHLARDRRPGRRRRTARPPFVGDAVVLAVDLGWSEADVLALTWDRLVTDEQGAPAPTGPARPDQDPPQGRRPALRHGPAPPGRPSAPATRPPASPRSRSSTSSARKRNHDRTEDADSHYFRKLFAKVRAEAAKACPSVAGLTFADTRDTGCSPRPPGRPQRRPDRQPLPAVAPQHQGPGRQAHYGEIGPEIADQARALLDPYIEAELKKWKVAL
jgi:hypothetical protein